MANKHSRQGLALGVSLAMGATTLGVLPAQAVDNVDLDLTIAADNTNGVLATTMENDFELELEWDTSNASDLAYLTYELTFMSSDRSLIDAKGAVNGIEWNATTDSVQAVTDTFDANYTYATATSPAPSVLLTAPAHITTTDNTLDYNYTVTRVGGPICTSDTIEGYTSLQQPTDFSYRYYDSNETSAVSWVREHLGGTEPTGSLATALGSAVNCQNVSSSDGGSVAYNVTFSEGNGFSGPLNRAADSGFESILTLQSIVSVDDYVDVVVMAWLDKDQDGIRDTGVNGEAYAEPLTVRFWNPDALTPVLTLADEGKVWFETAGEQVNVVTETYISQELNDVYTTDKGDVNDNYTVVNDRNYQNSRDGYVYPDTIGSDFKAALNNMAFGTGATPKYSGKHLFESKTLKAEQEDINRISVIDADQTQSDTFFSNVTANVDKIVSGPLMVSFHQRTVKDAVALPVESELVIAASSSAAESDSWAHESATQVQYVITLLDEDVTSWSEFDTTTVGAAKGIAAVDVTVNGSYAGNSAMGALAINGTSILDETSNATKVAGDFEMEATSNASGQIVLTIAVASPKDNMAINLTNVEVQGTTYALDDVDNNAANIDFQASVWDLVNELNAEDSSVRHVQVGDSTSVRYDVRDQFMRAPANGVARVLFEYNNTTVGNNVTGESRSFVGSIGDTVNVTNGGVTVVVPDVNPAAEEGSVTVSAKLYVQTSFGGWPAASVDSETMVIDYVENAAVEEIVQTDSSSTAQISYFNFSDINTELSRTTAAQKATIAGVDAVDSAATEITGIVRTAEGLPLRGHKVTISGAGLLFSDVDEFFGVGSLTLFTDSSGMYKFDVVGQVVGTATLTISSGGKSVTATHITTGANVRAHNVAITSAFAAKAGTADALTALVTDRYGNLANGKSVTFSVVSGSGYIQTPATVTTDAKGVATADLIIMSGEVGFNSTVRAAITQDDFAATSNSAAAQRSAGDTNVGKTTAWTKLQADGTAKMYAKNIVGAGKVQFFHNNKEIAWVRAADALNPKLRAANGAFYLVRTVELVDGKNVLEVYIDGERVRRTAYSK